MIFGHRVKDRSLLAKELSVVEALRAAKDLGDMRLENREMRLAIAPSDVARVLETLRAAANSAENRIASARSLAEDAIDKATFDALDKLTKDYVDVSVELAAALADYGDTVEKVRRAVAIGNQMTALIDKSTAAMLAAAEAGNEQANIESARVGIINLGIGLFVVIVLAGMAVFGALAISRPIRRIGDVLRQLAHGNKDVVVPYTRRADEVGDNARAAQAFKEMLIRVEHFEHSEKETTKRMDERRRAGVHDVAVAFETTVASVVRSVSSSSIELEAAAEALGVTAGATRDLSDKVLSASTQAANNVQSVSIATDELIASGGEIGRQVRESTMIAAEAVTQAKRTDGRIAELIRAAARIGDVVKLINAIAEQTNLLALNATIEAARAGAAGKGFAVVAQEVKALAAQTAKATNEIGQQIAAVQAATQDSVGSIKEIGGTINRIAEISAAITTAVEMQALVTREIAENVQAATSRVVHVTANIGKVNSNAADITSASSQILTSAKALAQDSTRLSADMEKLLTAVRSA